jgi:hypothetical protein
MEYCLQRNLPIAARKRRREIKSSGNPRGMCTQHIAFVDVSCAWLPSSVLRRLFRVLRPSYRVAHTMSSNIKIAVRVRPSHKRPQKGDEEYEKKNAAAMFVAFLKPIMMLMS